MKDFLHVIRSSQLFSGISENELAIMLSCLDTKKESFPKDAFLLRVGDTAESIGLVLSGSDHTGGYLGQPQYPFKGGAGAELCRRLRLCARFGAECERGSRNTCYGYVFECKAHTECVFVRLCAPQPDHPQPARRACREKPAFQ